MNVIPNQNPNCDFASSHMSGSIFLQIFPQTPFLQPELFHVAKNQGNYNIIENRNLQKNLKFQNSKILIFQIFKILKYFGFSEFHVFFLLKLSKFFKKK